MEKHLYGAVYIHDNSGEVLRTLFYAKNYSSAVKLAEAWQPPEFYSYYSTAFLYEDRLEDPGTIEYLFKDAQRIQITIWDL